MTSYPMQKILMGTECMGGQFKDDPAGIPLIPPGFTSLTSFTLERVHNDVTKSCLAPGRASISLHSRTDNQLTQTDNQCGTVGDEKFTKSLRQRPWINYKQFDNSSDEESDYEEVEQPAPSVCCLPKGVVRGCLDCKNCQKVLARWCPDNACRPVLDDAPVFYPTEEEFKDTVRYISRIRQKAEPYGICRIVPPPSWNPPCPLKEKTVWENSKFTTRIQQMDKLQHRDPLNKNSRYSGMSKKKRRRLETECRNSDGPAVENNRLGDNNSSERFGFGPGPEFTLESFQKYADDFKEQYFCTKDVDTELESNQNKFPRGWEPSVENIEGEYWRIVEKPTEEIEVLYGADIETGDFGSGFPKASSAPASFDVDDQYEKSGWNLNNIPRLPGSVLSFESGDISGVLVPWLYIGMCFSSFCWHVEDHHLYSMNYMHWGAPKIWYGVPGRYALKLEAAMKKHLPHLFEEQPNLLHNLVTQFSPSILKSEGVPVYRCIQRPGEFILTFPRAYHSGLNCGFNCAEAVNVAPIDWLPHGQNAVELYREQGRKITISHDKLLLGAAREAVRALWNISFLKVKTADNLLWEDACGPNGILKKALEARVEVERLRREYLCYSMQSRKMEAGFDADSERECFNCYYDLYLSAAGCPCSPDKFTCLEHAKHLCSCAWNTRFFLFRYKISELKSLVEALGGKLSAVHRWGTSNLGMSLRSYVSKGKTTEPGPVSSVALEGIKDKVQRQQNEGSSPAVRRNSCSSMEIKKSMPCTTSLDKAPGKENTPANSVSVTKIFDPSLLHQQTKSVANLHRKDTVVTNNPCVPAALFSGLRAEDQIFQVREGCSYPASEQNSVGHSASDHMAKQLSNLSKSDDMLSIRDGGTMLSSDSDGGVACESSSSKVVEAPIAKCPEVDSRVTVCEKVAPHILKKDQLFETPNTNAFSQSEGYNSSLPTVQSCHQSISIHGCEEGNDEAKDGKSGHNSSSRPSDKGPAEPSVIGVQSCPPNIFDRSNQQRGPRIAKVVRRVNCTVELLELGSVLSGELWSTSQSIYPKGYRSRVKYLSVLDPSQMCYYISEILDAGLLGPLFMVKVEHSPSEVFFHVSATRCWNMVRERVNDEIRRQHSLGSSNVPPLQPPGSLDGHEMFGLSSPTIVEAIEAIDRARICSEYWKSKPQVQNQHEPATSSRDHETNRKEEPSVSGQPGLPGIRSILSGLLKKACPEELQILHGILSSDCPSLKQEAFQLLNEEIVRQRTS